MIKRLAITAAALAALCSAIPAGAEEVGIGVGPGGITVGTSNHDRYRDREVIHERDRRDRDDTVVIRKHGDRDDDRDRKTIIIDRDR
ncbi:MAG: hypothetical protein HXX15_19195 [Rhodopseudomonas sp.]|uniref:hypothetical protein n=1 Tax=Rhodopseudomonas sp. TaxID=1078 RepID=UPI0017A203CD|nr:hypothetical protein [Rhodopseudomonas sp.]NVN88212.1 hypothetical protein [Rhodopseudomonas sp.]